MPLPSQLLLYECLSSVAVEVDYPKGGVLLCVAVSHTTGVSQTWNLISHYWFQPNLNLLYQWVPCVFMFVVFVMHSFSHPLIPYMSVTLVHTSRVLAL